VSLSQRAFFVIHMGSSAISARVAAFLFFTPVPSPLLNRRVNVPSLPVSFPVNAFSPYLCLCSVCLQLAAQLLGLQGPKKRKMLMELRQIPYTHKQDAI